MDRPLIAGHVEPPGAREELDAAIRQLGCRFRLLPGGRLQVDCPSHGARVRLLDVLAWHDATYDDRVRRLAVAIARDVGSDRLGRVDVSALPAALHRAVTERVRFLDEGPETMAKAWDTWESGVGDCDDSARLLLALARSVRVPAELVTLGPVEQPTHASVKLYDGAAWRWAEPSIRGARFGEEPRAAAARTGATRAELRGVLEGPPVLPRNTAGGTHLRVGVGGLATPEAAAIMRRIWPTDLLPLTPYALQVALAVARYETGFGSWPAGSPMEGSNNWGAVQCGELPIVVPILGTTICRQAGCASHSDSFPDGRRYDACFRRYSSHEEGARDLLRHLFQLRPKTRAAIAAGGPVRSVSAAMHAEHYYGGFCPEAVKAGAKPSTDDPRCAAEAIDLHAAKLRANAAEVAARLGEPDAVAAAESSRGVVVALVVAGVAGGLYAAHRARWF